MKVPIASIVIGERRRRARDVGELVLSIREVGQLTPVTITSDHRLVAGLHRILAFKQLGREEIEAHVVTLSDIDAQIAEIDENLVRHELSALERAEQFAHRKVLFEAKYPSTKRGGAPGKAGGGKAKTAPRAVFAEETAKKLGVSVRSVREDVQIATNLRGHIKEAIRGTNLADSKKELLKLARMPARKQQRVVTKIAAGKARGVAEAAARKGSGAWEAQFDERGHLIDMRNGLAAAYAAGNTLLLQWEKEMRTERADATVCFRKELPDFARVKEAFRVAINQCLGIAPAVPSPALKLIEGGAAS